MLMVTVGSVKVSPLPHGLMRTKTDIDTVRAMWTLVVTFPQEQPTDELRLGEALSAASQELLRRPVPREYREVKDFLVHRLKELVIELKYGPGGPRSGMQDVNRSGEDLGIHQRRNPPSHEGAFQGVLQPDRSKLESVPPLPSLTRKVRRVERYVEPAPGLVNIRRTYRQRSVSGTLAAAPFPRHRIRQSRTRERRGLLPILGDIGKSLFGLATEKDLLKLRGALEDNRKYTDAVRHDQERLLSVVNVTRAESVRNSESLHVMGSVIHAIRGQIERLESRSRSLSSYNLEFDRVRDKVSHLANQVQRVWYRRQQYLAARRDLESGSLSELLLPLDDLTAISEGKLPRGTRFVRPLVWYYSKADVRMTSVSGDLVYVVRLPLVDETDHQAIRLVSFPVPNVRRNVTVQLDVGGLISLNPVTGQTIGLDPDLCMGRDPMVCIPGPAPRHVQGKLTCANAVFVEKDVRKYCSAKVAARNGDQFHYHNINDYILTTWGTTLREQCDWDHPRKLDPGVYRVRWSGRCSLCTPDYCVPSSVQLHSAYQLQQWEPLNVSNLSIPPIKVQALPGLPDIPSMGDVKNIRLGDLLTATDPPPFAWSHEHTSIATDSAVGAVVVGVVAVAVLVCIRRFGCTGCRALFRKSERLHLNKSPLRPSRDFQVVKYQVGGTQRDGSVELPRRLRP